MWGEPILQISIFNALKFQLTRPVWGEPGRTYSILIYILFQLTRPVRGEPYDDVIYAPLSHDFNSLAPCGANPISCFVVSTPLPISTHSPRAGRTKASIVSVLVAMNFNSLAPCGANRRHREHFGADTDFNSLAPCGANPKYLCSLFCVFVISTHSPRAGRTSLAFINPSRSPNFNSLAPCGANPPPLVQPVGRYTFQLTRPVRGEPVERQRPAGTDAHFNSLAPCGANRRLKMIIIISQRISTHSPRAGRTVDILKTIA